MKRFVLVFLVLAAPAQACLQSYYTTLDGKRTVVSEMPGITQVSFINSVGARRAYWEDERKKFAGKKDYQSRNDYAVASLHLGETAQALPMLEALERERPGVYQTAANLGTAYELAGRNTDALRWIREGIKRNPRSHEGTEWLHTAILEAKLAQARDPKWLATHSILGLDFGPNARPAKPKALPKGNDGKPVTAKALQEALFYQLMERRQFVNPPDVYVADLFFDWGNITAVTATLENAIEQYDEALRFGSAHAELVKQRRAYVKRVIQRAS
jgi:tetratricopeptide (TPR) repeat protein